MPAGAKRGPPGALLSRDIESPRSPRSPAATPRAAITAPRARTYRVPELVPPQLPVKTRIALLWLRTLQAVAGAITCAANAYFLFLYTTGRRNDDRDFQIMANTIMLVGSGVSLVLAVLWLLLTLRPPLRTAGSSVCICGWLRPYTTDLFWDVMLAIFNVVMLCMFSLHYPKTMPGIATSAVLLMLSVSGAACCAYMARHVTLDALVVAEVIPPGPLGNRKPRTGIPGMV